jgi:predicted permease
MLPHMGLDLTLVAHALLPVAAILLVGGLCQSRGWVPPAGEQTLARLVVNVFWPAFILYHVLGNEALRSGSLLLGSVTTGFVVTTGGMLVARLFARAANLGEPIRQRTFAFSTGILNYGYLPIPLVMALYDSATLGVLLAVNAGVELAIWSVGLLALRGRFQWSDTRKMLNPPLVTLLFALSLNALGWGVELPAVLQVTARQLGACAVPVGILVTGVTIAELLRDNRRAFMREHATSLSACLLRSCALPLLMLATVWLLTLPTELERVIVIHAAMPAGIFPIVLARHYGGHPMTALRVTLSTTLCAIFATPFWLILGSHIL